MNTYALSELARLFWQTTKDIPQFILGRMDEFVKREQRRDALQAIVGKDEALLWLNLLGGDEEAALNLVQAGYSLQQIDELQQSIRHS